MSESTTARDEIHVLHVDDEPDFLDLASAFLERERDDLAVSTTTSASEGLDRLADDAIDHEIECIVSDYDMPEMNGLTFLEAVRETHPDLPFVLFTGKGSEEIASEAITAGVTDYLNKGTGTDQYTLLANRIANTVSQYRAEDALEETTEQVRQHRTTIEAMDDAVYVLDSTGEFVHVNEGFTTLTGYDADTVVGSDVDIIKDAETVARFEAIVGDLLSADVSNTTVEFDIETESGERVHCEDHLTLRMVDGEFEGVVGAIRDITARHESEQYRKRLYEILAEAGVDVEATIRQTLELGCEYLDVESGFLTRIEADTQRIEAAHGPNEQLQPGMECPLSASYCRKTIESDEPITVQHATETDWQGDPAHDRFELETYVGSALTVDGDLHGTVCFADRSPRETELSTLELAFVELATRGIASAIQRAEHRDELETAQARFRSLTRNTSLGVVTIDAHSTVRFANDGIEDVFGYPPEELVGESLSAVIPDHLEPAHFEALGQYLETGERRLDWEWIELPARHRDGSEVEVGVSFGEYVADGEHLFTGVVRNITNRKERQRALRSTTEVLSALLATHPDGVLVEDATGTIQFANEAFCELFDTDRSPAELEGRSRARILDHQAEQFRDPAAVTDRAAWMVAERAPVTGERLEREDGRLVEREYVPIAAGDDENHQRNLWVYRDVTERSDASGRSEHSLDEPAR